MKTFCFLDLFCSAGGASKGYYEALKKAGYHVRMIGVDINPQPNYPFEFMQADAMKLLKDTAFIRTFDAVAASPPCQGYSWSAQRWEHHRTKTPKLIPQVRKLLVKAGVPFIIENVVGSPLINAVYLEGPMFQPAVSPKAPGVIRRRLFEANFPIPQPARVKPTKDVRSGNYVTVAGHGGDGRAALYLWKIAMGIDWMTKEELAQAIPPCYTEYVGQHLIQWIQTGRATHGDPGRTRAKRNGR